uniref:Uncharacterized protein n=1 Tax=uncultured organism MedDCM-OCT-S04-C777 TaxID=743619 RepID=D6PK91_9ZZZZ|nr:hypothetical protein [uncultured organism MedDCM-OCT-S04-C777]
MAKQKFTHFIPRENLRREKVYIKKLRIKMRRDKEADKIQGSRKMIDKMIYKFLVCLTSLLVI